MRQVVVFYTYPKNAAESNQGQTPTVPALVVAQHSDTCLNLRVFQDGAANPAWKTSVPRRDASNEEHGGYWESVEDVMRREQPSIADPNAGALDQAANQAGSSAAL
jgi:hypothetical protein